jgi:hypothetical protein
MIHTSGNGKRFGAGGSFERKKIMWRVPLSSACAYETVVCDVMQVYSLTYGRDYVETTTRLRGLSSLYLHVAV